MARRAFVAQFLFLCLLVLLIVDAAAATGGFIVSSVASGEAATQREFDYFTLALRWPGTYCKRTHLCCFSNACCRSNPLTEFTIHGLWPDYNDGSYPSCCRNSSFSIQKISSLLPELRKHWPSLSCVSQSLCHGSNGLFWAHEWENHGTCSYPVISHEHSYFSAALVLYFKYNITGILSNEGIVPSNAKKYSVEDIFSVIRKAVGAWPILECRRGFLEEIQLCFDKKFKPRDCSVNSGVRDGETLSSTKSCPGNITLPTYTHNGNVLNGDASSAVSWLIRDEPVIPFNVM